MLRPLLTLLLLSLSAPALAQMGAPGYRVSEYATVPAGGPVFLSFDPASGALYVGSCIGLTDNHISRIPPGGGVGVPYGPLFPDPDAVLFDESGCLSGVPGAVVVGYNTSSGGVLAAVLPDESMIPVVGPSSSFFNPGEMTFDLNGRFVMYNDSLSVPSIVVGGGPLDCETPVGQLAALPVRGGAITIDTQNRIHTRGFDGLIITHDAAGAPLANPYPTDLGDPTVAAEGLAAGTGSPTWGDDLYTIDAPNDRLVRIDLATGALEVIATGLSNRHIGMIFGPDDALYLADFNADRILRVERCLGTNYCVPTPNSTGAAALICAQGSAVLGQNELALIADGIPAGKLGYFITGPAQTYVMPLISQGFICVGGGIGRFNKPGQIGFGPVVETQVDLTALPQAGGAAPVLPGETWNFQAWYRDTGGNNNFTDAVSVAFQ